jgi:hypothetical protein
MIFDYQTSMPSDGNMQEFLDLYQEPAPFEEYARYFVGVDLGQRMDYTAVAVLEQHYDERGRSFYETGWLKRFPLMTRYSSIAKQLKKLDTKLRLRAAKQEKSLMLTYLVDAGGVGNAAVELCEVELPNADIYRCFITGGLHATVDSREREIRIPKFQLVSTLVALFDSERIHFPKDAKYIEAMVEELESYEVHVSESGNEQYAARSSRHDDLICAVSLPAWYSQQESTADMW